MNIAKSLIVAVGFSVSVLAQTYSATVKADEPFVGEVRWFAGNFAPRGWAKCDGQLLPINQYQALFSLLGTIYGGDGRTTFALPDMRGRSMLSFGSGPGLTPKGLGAKSGQESVILNNAQIPEHNHALNTSNLGGDSSLPHARVLSSTGRLRIYQTDSSSASLQPMNNSAISSSGGGQAHNNMQPYIAMTCIIALQGIYPSRS